MEQPGFFDVDEQLKVLTAAGDPPAARQVSESCGYLPLALALAGARIQGGGRWEDVRATLERGRLEFLDHPYGSVASARPPAGQRAGARHSSSPTSIER